MKLSSVSLIGLAAVGWSNLVRGASPVTDGQLKTETTPEGIKSVAKDSVNTPLRTQLDMLAGADDDSSWTTSWTPALGDSWNYNLNTPVKRTIDVDVFLIDMDGAQETINNLHRRGKHVVCYISIGSAEEWRDDFDILNNAENALGEPLGDWPGEWWLDINNEVVRTVMVDRVKTAASMHCDGIEPDNMMAYIEEDTGFTFTEDEQISYNKWFADVVHSCGMNVALKNSVEILEDLVDSFDFAVNESCNLYNECEGYSTTFLAQGKPVFNVEYVNNMDMCDYANNLGMDTIVKNIGLYSAFCSCVDSARDWRCNRVV